MNRQDIYFTSKLNIALKIVLEVYFYRRLRPRSCTCSHIETQYQLLHMEKLSAASRLSIIFVFQQSGNSIQSAFFTEVKQPILFQIYFSLQQHGNTWRKIRGTNSTKELFLFSALVHEMAENNIFQLSLHWRLLKFCF